MAVDWSDGLRLIVPTSLDPMPVSHCSLAVLVIASAVVAVGFCHSAEEDEDVPPKGVLDVVAR